MEDKQTLLKMFYNPNSLGKRLPSGRVLYCEVDVADAFVKFAEVLGLPSHFGENREKTILFHAVE